jgi:hypothetical protein
MKLPGVGLGTSDKDKIAIWKSLDISLLFSNLNQRTVIPGGNQSFCEGSNKFSFPISNLITSAVPVKALGFSSSLSLPPLCASSWY